MRPRSLTLAAAAGLLATAMAIPGVAGAAPETSRAGAILVSEDTDYPSVGTPVAGFDPPGPAVGSFMYRLDLATGARRALYDSRAGDPSDPDGRNRAYTQLGAIDRSARTGLIVSQLNGSSFGVLRDDGTGLRALPSDLGRAAPRGGRDARPQWSPDGSRFAFVGFPSSEQRRPQLGVLIAGADGTGLRHLPVPHDGSDVSALDWSARGELAYADGSGIVRVSRDLERRTRIVRTSGDRRIRSLAWSPSGRTLAYARDEPSGPEKLFDRDNRLITVGRDGKGARTVARSRRDSLYGFGSYPIAWSPSGNRLLFGSVDRKDTSTERLATVGARGGATHTVLRRDGYSPDGVVISPAIKGFAWASGR